jgi:hypothetical protein
VIALVAALVLIVVVLWSASIGAVLLARREQRRDLATACRAWVPLARDNGQLYRCAAPVRPGNTRCGTHATVPDPVDGRPRLEMSRQEAHARALTRWGLPVTAAISFLVILIVLVRA